MSRSVLWKSALLAGGLALWYALTGPSAEQLRNKKEYPLPDEIKVVETSLPHNDVTMSYEENPEERGIKVTYSLEKIVKTSEIDFSTDFYLKTDRYTLVKDKDWLPSRIIGHAVSTLSRLYFWDWNYAWGQDEQRTKAALSILENHPEIKGLTVRLNHNEALSDMLKMFSDEKLKDRNGWWARVLIGIPTSLGDELWAEFLRGSYYNPLTQTTVCYSNIESITAHEIGHHKDFQRFDSDGLYMLARIFPPAMLYQEWKATQNARQFLAADDQYQYSRYLIPAFFTYLLGGYYVSKKMLQRKALKARGDKRDLSKIKAEDRPAIHPLLTLTHFGSYNASFYACIGTHAILSSANSTLGYIGSAGILFGGLYATDKIFQAVINQSTTYPREFRTYRKLQ